MPVSSDDLRQVQGRESLYAFLEKLGWPVTPEDTFTYAGPQLDGELAVRAEVRQIVPFGANDPFAIFLVEFASAFRRTDLREILRRIRAEIRTQARYDKHNLEELIFVCATENYGGVSFAHFEERAGRAPRLEVFGWDQAHVTETHTLRHVNLEAVRMPPTNLLGEYDWAAGRKAWLEAWDVEKVTSAFFKQYKTVFEAAEADISEVKGDKRLFTQRLFNRLLFIHFLSKKRWLRFGGRYDYLQALWDGRDKSLNFYSAHLRPLFASALNNPHCRSLASDNPTIHKLIGDVPYLNGGLFQPEDSDGQGEQVEDTAIERILALFAQYNFTITESAPDDVQVAVDPEMLGKVFEELVTGRHETGSYYTPRPVVAFMCREALKGYLAPYGTAAIAAFVDEGRADGLSNPEGVLAALKAVRVCDPACGSGAYLLGMMQELLRLRGALFAAKAKDFALVYQRKLEIIERNLYGADLDPFAAGVAMLRLWLSLVVDDLRDALAEPRPEVSLPNLKFKIQVGDSLLAPAPNPAALTLHAQAYEADAHALAVLHREYFAAHPSQAAPTRTKQAIDADITAVQARLQSLLGSSPVGSVDWRVAFAEVFAPQTPLSEDAAPGGFNVVLANPPYVRADPQFKHLKPDEKARQAAIAEYKAFRASLVKSEIYETLYEKWDLYIPFLERASQLLRTGGGMVFIIPDAYNAAKYATRSHEFFLQHSRVQRIDFCSEIDLFDAGVNNTILYFVKEKADSHHAPMRVRRWGDDREKFDDHAEVLPTFPQAEFGATLFKFSGQRNANTDLLTLSQVCYISWGLRPCGDDEHKGDFIKADLISTRKDLIHLKPYVEAKGIINWCVNRVQYLEWNTERSPAFLARPTFPELYEVPEKLLALDISGQKQRVAYDDNQLVCNNSISCCVQWHLLAGVKNNSIKKTAKYKSEVKPSEIPPARYREQLEEESQKFSIKYLLGVMNSEYAKNWLANQRRSKLHIYPDDWKGLPIAPATPDQQAEIAALVQQCLAAKGVGCTVWEQEINARVAALYGL